MKKLTMNEAADYLLSLDHIAIISHRRPDGDTLGSSAALCLGLRQLGKRAWVMENPELTEHYRWLHQGLEKPDAHRADAYVSVDVASPSMLPRNYGGWPIALRLDHHGSATSFTELEYVDPTSASCAEIIWEILALMGVKRDRAMAEAVYVGLATDTGCFHQSNTSAHSFQVAAQCMEAGARVFELNQYLFENNTLQRLKMQAWIVEHLRILADGCAVCAIPKRVEEEIGVTEDDMDNISSFPRTVAGVRMASTLREQKDGVKLSIRAIPGYDATIVAEQFGGGGHKGAAGALLRMPLDVAEEAVAQAMLTDGQ